MFRIWRTPFEVFAQFLTDGEFDMIRRARRPLAVSGALLVYWGAASPAADLTWKLDERTAARLAAEGFDHGKDQKWFDYDPGIGRPFFVFYGLNESDGGFGYFAVNPWTGDVWDLSGCHKLSTPALRESQAAILRRFSPEEMKQYARLARLKPECVVED